MSIIFTEITKKLISKFIIKLINEIKINILGKNNDTYDILHIAQICASLESATYFNKKMYKSKNFESDLDLLTHAMEIRPKDGVILEFGVASGRTINHIASLTEKTVYGFDTFGGLPETWRTGFEKGCFKQENLPLVKENVKLIKGLFSETLEDFLQSNVSSISLIHIDCDLYQGTKDIFNKLGSLINPGTVIVFDEYFNYPGWEEHEYKAFQEFINSSKYSYKYDSIVSKHQQVCVIID